MKNRYLYESGGYFGLRLLAGLDFDSDGRREVDVLYVGVDDPEQDNGLLAGVDADGLAAFALEWLLEPVIMLEQLPV